MARNSKRRLAEFWEKTVLANSEDGNELESRPFGNNNSETTGYPKPPVLRSYYDPDNVSSDRVKRFIEATSRKSDGGSDQNFSSNRGHYDIKIDTVIEQSENDHSDSAESFKAVPKLHSVICS